MQIKNLHIPQFYTMRHSASNIRSMFQLSTHSLAHVSTYSLLLVTYRSHQIMWVTYIFGITPMNFNQ